MVSRRVTDFLLFACVFTMSFEKLFWDFGGSIALSEVFAILFVLGYALRRIGRRESHVPRTAGVVAAFFASFLLVYLVGFYNLETSADRDQFVKGLAKFAIHFAFVVAAVAYLSRRSPRLYWQTLAWFCAGFVANAAYGLAQLALAETGGVNLDQMLLGRLGLYERGGINVFGAVGQAAIYRTNALTLDPNHLGVMLVVPLLVLFPLYLRLERGHPLRALLALVLAFLALVELSTLSRSGLLGLAVGFCVLAIPYARSFLRLRALLPLALVALVVGVVVAERTDFVRRVVEVRTATSGRGTQTHLQFYSLVRPALEDHPFFGMGLNTFSVYYEFITGRTNYGPHSYWVALLTETGVVGTALFLCYLVFLFRRLGALRRLGRRLALAGDRAALRVRPLAWGLTAALLGTMAANAFYLTMQMYYFFVFALLVVAAPVVFARR